MGAPDANLWIVMMRRPQVGYVRCTAVAWPSGSAARCASNVHTLTTSPVALGAVSAHVGASAVAGDDCVAHGGDFELDHREVVVDVLRAREHVGDLIKRPADLVLVRDPPRGPDLSSPFPEQPADPGSGGRVKGRRRRSHSDARSAPLRRPPEPAHFGWPGKGEPQPAALARSAAPVIRVPTIEPLPGARLRKWPRRAGCASDAWAVETMRHPGVFPGWRIVLTGGHATRASPTTGVLTVLAPANPPSGRRIAPRTWPSERSGQAAT